MSIENLSTIDAIIKANDSSLAMAIWNPLKWDYETFLKLQTKINAYLKSGYAREIVGNRSNSLNRALVIKLVSRYEPDPDSELFLKRLESFLGNQGVRFSHAISPSFEDALHGGNFLRFESNIDLQSAHRGSNEDKVSKGEIATSPPQHYAYNCFISYTTREEEVQMIKPFVDDFIGELQSRGVRVCPVFYDGYYLRSTYYEGEELRKYLRDAIEESAFMIAFLSPQYLNSEWCTYELGELTREHGSRGTPATRWSILPVEWKSTDRGSQQFRRYADYLRLTDHGDHAEHMQACMGAVGKYLSAWYPTINWDYQFLS